MEDKPISRRAGTYWARAAHWRQLKPKQLAPLQIPRRSLGVATSQGGVVLLRHLRSTPSDDFS